MTDGPAPARGGGLFRALYLLLGVYALLVPAATALIAWLGVQGVVSPWVGLAALGAPLLLLTTATVLFARRRVARPLTELLRRIEAIARGELEGTLAIERRDEIGRLNRALNELAAYLVVAREARVDRRFLQRVIDAMPEALVVLDARGVIELHNRHFATLLGLDGSLTGVHVDSLVRNQPPGWATRVVRTAGVDNVEVDFGTADGPAITLLTSSAHLQAEDADAERTVLVARDTSAVAGLMNQLRQANAGLEESRQFFQNLFDAMEDPITVLAPDGEVMQANRAARAVFGRDVVGRRCYRAFRMRDSVCDGCPALQTYASRKSVSVEHRVFGNAITRISTYPLLGKNGEVRAIINHKRDVTKERQLEDLKANFLAAVSHELRTPLTSLKGFNKLNLRRLVRFVQPALEAAPHKVRVAFGKVLEDMQVMDSEAERLGRLVNDVLDLSKLEAGKLTLTMGEVDAGALVQGGIVATAALWRDKGLRVEAQVPEGCPPGWGDADRLSQVLVNLFSNAIKFTAEGRITAEVRVHEDVLRFTVRDTGKGIAPDDLGGVFEKFRQADGEGGAQIMKGTGLGLPICKELIRLHEGRIWVESTLGEGSAFHFTIPRADVLDDLERSIRAGPSITGL
ncbi:MAG: PAS domain-containing protein [Myxococcales bacterium]|nr:PAS domain-containing protein [Myxococcales bacterium]